MALQVTTLAPLSVEWYGSHFLFCMIICAGLSLACRIGLISAPSCRKLQKKNGLVISHFGPGLGTDVVIFQHISQTYMVVGNPYSTSLVGFLPSDWCDRPVYSPETHSICSTAPSSEPDFRAHARYLGHHRGPLETLAPKHMLKIIMWTLPQSVRDLILEHLPKAYWLYLASFDTGVFAHFAGHPFRPLCPYLERLRITYRRFCSDQICTYEIEKRRTSLCRVYFYEDLLLYKPGEYRTVRW